MNSVFEWLTTALGEHALLAVFAATCWGVASVALSPCHLASVPLAVAFLKRDGQGSALGISVSLAVGVLASLALVGLVSVAAGRIAGDLWGLGPWLTTAALLLAGLYFLDVLALPGSFTIDPRRLPRNGWRALILGVLLGVSLGPCTFAFFAPIFAAAFGAASHDASLSTALVAAFAAGHILAIAAAGLLGLKLSGWLRAGGVATSRLRGLFGSALVASAVFLVATAP